MNRDASCPGIRARERGFTLIELLVSLAILSVTLVLIGSALRVLTTNWDRNTERIASLDMVARAFDILRRDAAGLQRLVTVSGSDAQYVFRGAPDKLAFITQEPPYPSEGGPYFVEYSVVADGTKSELIRARAPYEQDMHMFPGATPANRVPLLQGRFQYQFSYLQRAASGETWQGSWSSRTRLPDLIRLQVLDARSGEAAMPAFIVGIRSDAELTCLGDQADLCSAKKDGDLGAPDHADSEEDGRTE